MTSKSMMMVGATVAAAVTLAACGSQDPRDVATTLIEGELSDQIGLGALTEARCDSPAENVQGEFFDCSATSPDGDTITFVAEFVEDDEIFVRPTNVIGADEMALVEAEAAEVLSPEVGVDIDPAAVECPEVTTVLGTDGRLSCVITDAVTDDRYDLTATFADFDGDNGFQQRNYEIGDLISG